MTCGGSGSPARNAHKAHESHGHSEQTLADGRLACPVCRGSGEVRLPEGVALTVVEDNKPSDYPPSGRE